MGHGMIAVSLAAGIALLAPAPESLIPQVRPYAAVAPQGSQARVLSKPSKSFISESSSI